MHQKNEKKTLTAALSTTLPYAVIEMKPVLTRSNSDNHKFISKKPFTRDRSSFQATFRASFRRKPILKKSNQPFQTLKEDITPDGGLLLSSYQVSRDVESWNIIDERITERKRTKYRNPYKDFDSKEYERKEKRFLTSMAYLFTFIVVFFVFIATIIEVMELRTVVKKNSILTAGIQSDIVTPPVALDPFNVDIANFFMTNDSRSKATISKKVADMRRQIIRSRYE